MLKFLKTKLKETVKEDIKTTIQDNAEILKFVSCAVIGVIIFLEQSQQGVKTCQDVIINNYYIQGDYIC